MQPPDILAVDTTADAAWHLIEGDLVVARLGAVIASAPLRSDREWLQRLRPLGAVADDASWPQRLVALRAALAARARRHGPDEPWLQPARRVLADGLRGEYDAVDLASDLIARAHCSLDGPTPTDLAAILDCYLSFLTALETAP